MQVTAPTILHIHGEGRRVTMKYDESFPQLVLPDRLLQNGWLQKVP